MKRLFLGVGAVVALAAACSERGHIGSNTLAHDQAKSGCFGDQQRLRFDEKLNGIVSGSPRWLSDDQCVGILQGPDYGVALSFATGRAEKIAEWTDHRYDRFSFSADGKWVLANASDGYTLQSMLIDLSQRKIVDRKGREMGLGLGPDGTVYTSPFQPSTDREFSVSQVDLETGAVIEEFKVPPLGRYRDVLLHQFSQESFLIAGGNQTYFFQSGSQQPTATKPALKAKNIEGTFEAKGKSLLVTDMGLIDLKTMEAVELQSSVSKHFNAPAGLKHFELSADGKHLAVSIEGVNFDLIGAYAVFTSDSFPLPVRAISDAQTLKEHQRWKVTNDGLGIVYWDLYSTGFWTKLYSHKVWAYGAGQSSYGPDNPGFIP